MNTKLMLRFFLFFWITLANAKETVNLPPKTTSKSADLACVTGSASEYLEINNVKARLFNTGGLFFKDTDEYYVKETYVFIRNLDWWLNYNW